MLQTFVVADINVMGDANNAMHIDDFAMALEANTSLTRVEVKYSRDKDFAKSLQFVCRIYTRRNQIRQMVQRDELPQVLWPQVLQSLASTPSAIFLTMAYVKGIIPTRKAGRDKEKDDTRSETKR